MITYGDALAFVKTLRVEPIIFLHAFARTVSDVTISLLIQEKICVNVFEQSNEFCANLNSVEASKDPGDYKNKVLALSTQFDLYKTLLITIPSVIWSLFIGSFTDKCRSGRKVIMCLSTLSAIMTNVLYILNAFYFHWSLYYLLLITVPPILTGGTFGSIMAIYSYVSLNTKESQRSIRYALIEFSLFLGGPLGTYLGGQLLKTTLNSTGGQLHNYILVISVGLISNVISLALILILINEKRDEQNNNDLQDLVDNEDPDHNSNQIDKTVHRVESQPSEGSQTTSKWYSPIKLMFDLQNVSEVWMCCTKRRPNSGRLQIWILFMSMCVMLLALMGTLGIQFQFAEKVYLWSATYYSNVDSISSVVSSVFMTIAVPILVVKLRLRDTQLAIVGFISAALKALTIGSYQHPIGYYLSVVIGSIGGMISIGIRSKLSKIVVKDELGKVFSLLSTLESVTPLVSSLIFTFIFQSSLHFYPGLSYEVSSAFYIIPLIAIAWMDVNINRST